MFFRESAISLSNRKSNGARLRAVKNPYIAVVFESFVRHLVTWIVPIILVEVRVVEHRSPGVLSPYP